jgi:DNA-binding transcriptional MerR regulator
MANGTLGIGAVARRSGLSVPTIRYYEEIGLLRPAGRRGGGHRVYGSDDLRRLTFIARCRDLGFPIDRIRSLLAVTVDNRPCADARTIATDHLAQVNTKIDELIEIKHHLEGFVRECSTACSASPAASCVMIDGLSRRKSRPSASR